MEQNNITINRSSRAKIGKDLFCEGYNCAQATFCAYCDLLGYDIKTAAKISSSFGGGMGRLREVCGACTAVFAVAGTLYGYDTPGDDEAKAEHYALVQRIAEEFRKKHGTIICRELLAGIEDSTSPIPSKRTKEYYASRPCAEFVATACEILDRIINEREEESHR